ncbi:MAG: DUF2188 domain-containing protein [Candidatus Peribacteraceae bacterium]|nr:DUF2188 domain-containing protein [Candidatus Peribacteraceae bacterium]
MNKGKFLPRRQKNNPVIQRYTQAVKRGRHILSTAQHVVPSEKGWAVKKAGAKKPSQICSTQKQAIKVATKTAKNQSTELFIHDRKGRIRERNSYGRDPFPPRG